MAIFFLRSSSANRKGFNFLMDFSPSASAASELLAVVDELESSCEFISGGSDSIAGFFHEVEDLTAVDSIEQDPDDSVGFFQLDAVPVGRNGVVTFHLRGLEAVDALE
jgi:hypothetical protein